MDEFGYWRKMITDVGAPFIKYLNIISNFIFSSSVYPFGIDSEKIGLYVNSRDALASNEMQNILSIGLDYK
jgi:hypothetical protein